MSAKVNFTGSVDRDLLKRAKVVAAESETNDNIYVIFETRSFFFFTDLRLSDWCIYIAWPDRQRD